MGVICCSIACASLILPCCSRPSLCNGWALTAWQWAGPLLERPGACSGHSMQQPHHGSGQEQSKQQSQHGSDQHQSQQQSQHGSGQEQSEQQSHPCSGQQQPYSMPVTMASTTMWAWCPLLQGKGFKFRHSVSSSCRDWRQHVWLTSELHDSLQLYNYISV